MVEGAEGIFVRAVCMRYGRKLHHDLRLDLAQCAAEQVVVARVNDMKRDTRFVQQTHPLVDNMEVESLIRIADNVRKRAEIVDLKTVGDVDVSAGIVQRQRQVMANEPGAANQ